MGKGDRIKSLSLEKLGTLISVVAKKQDICIFSATPEMHGPESPTFQEFYSVIMRGCGKVDILYGEKDYSSKIGDLIFVAPGQVLGFRNWMWNEKRCGWALAFSSNFLKGSHLAEQINNYRFFRYTFNEGLDLNETEKNVIQRYLITIREELSNEEDEYSKPIILGLLKALLDNCQRIYDKKTYTDNDEKGAHLLLFEKLLRTYFINEAEEKGFPTTKTFSDRICVTPGHLSDILRKKTGHPTSFHIKRFALEIATTDLSCTRKSINEISERLGFKSCQYFVRFFKKETGLTPARYRKLVSE